MANYIELKKEYIELIDRKAEQIGEINKKLNQVKSFSEIAPLEKDLQLHTKELEALELRLKKINSEMNI